MDILTFNVANAHISYDDQTKRLSRINIVKLNFTLGFGTGLILIYHINNEIEVEVIIENSEFSHNNGQYAEGV